MLSSKDLFVCVFRVLINVPICYFNFGPFAALLLEQVYSCTRTICLFTFSWSWCNELIVLVSILNSLNSCLLNSKVFFNFLILFPIEKKTLTGMLILKMMCWKSAPNMVKYITFMWIKAQPR